MPKNRDNELAFFKALEDLSANLQKSFEETRQLVESSFADMFHRKYDPDAEIELQLDIEKKSVKLVNKSFEVVKNDFPIQKNELFLMIILSDAQKINPEIKLGDFIEKEIAFDQLDLSEVKRVMQSTKQKVRETEKKIILEKYSNLKDQIIDVLPLVIQDEFVAFQLLDDDSIKVIMPKNKRNPLIKITRNKITKVLVEEIVSTPKTQQIVVSNVSPIFVQEALKIEIPEIAEGLIQIVKVVRQAGNRTKIAVNSLSENIDPVATCLGQRGNRINAVIERISPEVSMNFREKIDIVKYFPDKVEYIKNAMSPALVVSVQKTGEFTFLVIVPNSQLSLAIGKYGSNVRLASELTDSQLDIKSIGDAQSEGIVFDYNGNVSKENLRLVESGEVSNLRHLENMRKSPKIDLDAFSRDISNFQADIVSRKSTSDLSEVNNPRTMNINKPSRPMKKSNNNAANDFSAKDFDDLDFKGDVNQSDLFSDDELAEMEKQFGLKDFNIGDEFDDEFDDEKK